MRISGMRTVFSVESVVLLLENVPLKSRGMSVTIYSVENQDIFPVGSSATQHDNAAVMDVTDRSRKSTKESRQHRTRSPIFASSEKGATVCCGFNW